MEKKVVALLVFLVTFLISMSLSEKIWEGEDVKNLFKDMKEKGKEFFDDISFDEINEYMRDKLNLLLTYLRKNPENGKSEEKSRKLKKTGSQNGVAETETNLESTDGSESEEEDDGIAEKNTKNTCDDSDSDGKCDFIDKSGNGDLSESRLSGVRSTEEDLSEDSSSEVDLNGRTGKAWVSSVKECDANTDKLPGGETIIEEAVESDSAQTVKDINPRDFHATENKNYIEVNVAPEKNYIDFSKNAKEEITGDESIESENSSVTDNSSESSTNVTVYSDYDNNLGDTKKSSEELDADGGLAAEKQSEFSNSNVDEAVQCLKEEDSHMFVTSEDVNFNDSEDFLEKKSADVLQHVNNDESLETNIKLEPLDSSLHNITNLNERTTESEINILSNEEVKNTGKTKYKIEKQEYEYKRKSYRVFSKPSEESAHVHSSDHRNHGGNGPKVTTVDGVTETQTDELTETMNEADSVSDDADDIVSDTNTNLNNFADDSNFRSSSHYGCEEKTFLEEENGITFEEDVIRQIEKKVMSSVSGIPKNILDSFLNLDSVIGSPDENSHRKFDSVKSSPTEKPRYKDLLNIIKENLIHGHKELEAMSVKNFLITYISDKLDKLFTDKLQAFLKPETYQALLENEKEGKRDVITDLKQDVFSTLLDAYLLFYEPKIEQDTILPIEDLKREYHLQTTVNTPQYSYRRQKIAESVGILHSELKKERYDYKEEKAEGDSDQSKSRGSYTVSASESLEEQQENTPADNLKFEEQQHGDKTSQDFLKEPSSQSDQIRPVDQPVVRDGEKKDEL